MLPNKKVIIFSPQQKQSTNFSLDSLQTSIFWRRFPLSKTLHADLVKTTFEAFPHQLSKIIAWTSFDLSGSDERGGYKPPPKRNTFPTSWWSPGFGWPSPGTSPAAEVRELKAEGRAQSPRALPCPQHSARRFFPTGALCSPKEASGVCCSH